MNTDKKTQIRRRYADKLGKLAICVSVLFLFTICVTSVVHAQTLSLSLYPPLLEVMIQPGKTITQVYKLNNSGEIDLAFNSKVVPFEPTDEKGSIRLLTSEVFSDWFSFQNAYLDLGQRFFLKAGEEQEIVLKIKVPANAPEDDYYSTLLLETLPGVFMGQGTQAQAKIGGNILLTVSKDGKPLKKAEIIEFRPKNCLFSFGYLPRSWRIAEAKTQPGWCLSDSFDRPEFSLRVKNTGKAFFKPMGTITITGWFGQKFILDLLPENVLVESVRAINCVSPDSPDEFGPCQLGSRFLLGRYQAEVEFGLDQLNPDYSAKTTFFALPVKLIFGLIIVGAIFWLVKSKLGLDKRFL